MFHIEVVKGMIQKIYISLCLLPSMWYKIFLAFYKYPLPAVFQGTTPVFQSWKPQTSSHHGGLNHGCDIGNPRQFQIFNPKSHGLETSCALESYPTPVAPNVTDLKNRLNVQQVGCFTEKLAAQRPSNETVQNCIKTRMI